MTKTKRYEFKTAEEAEQYALFLIGHWDNVVTAKNNPCVLFAWDEPSPYRTKYASHYDLNSPGCPGI